MNGPVSTWKFEIFFLFWIHNDYYWKRTEPSTYTTIIVPLSPTLCKSLIIIDHDYGGRQYLANCDKWHWYIFSHHHSFPLSHLVTSPRSSFFAVGTPRVFLANKIPWIVKASLVLYIESCIPCAMPRPIWSSEGELKHQNLSPSRSRAGFSTGIDVAWLWMHALTTFYHIMHHYIQLCS